MTTKEKETLTQANGVPSWFIFPTHERLLESGALVLLIAKMEQTHHELTSIECNGTPAEKARARVARTAYDHSLELARALAKPV